MRAPVFVAIVAGVALAAQSAQAGRDLCARGAIHRGAVLDLDVKDADIHEVFRLLSDVGHVNVVISDEVTGNVTLRIRRAPWDQIACAIAGVHHLRITVNGTVLMIQPGSPTNAARSAGPARRS